mmetsp:Transcript_42695/g.76801  ORF Transcript_42695/g.76801 Transcript_42695/m.76801 type:complete len:373 (-) Transcript_42695:36-1154(-)
MALSCRVLEGPKEGEACSPGSLVQWVLLNDGPAWPHGTTLRLVGGPVLASPIVAVPEAARGQTVVLELEALEPEGAEAESYHTLVSPQGEPFGEILFLKVKKVEAAPAVPTCAVIAAPAEGLTGLQGELKEVEWTLANFGAAPWPADAVAQLIYNSPGFAHLPGQIELPKVAPGMTAQLGVTALMPEMPGCWKAMWAVTSASMPDFGDILYVDFTVDDFPFMEWMLEESPQAETISEASETEEKLSAAFAACKHLVPDGAEVDFQAAPSCPGIEQLESLGNISNVVPGTLFSVELMLANDGSCAWPADSKLVCCFGDAMSCEGQTMPCEVAPGSAVALRLDFTAAEAPTYSGWVMISNDGEPFGPVFLLKME